AALRGKKRHARTDKTDTPHLRVHLMAGDLPESPGSRRNTCWRRGLPSGCIRTCWMSAGAGTSGWAGLAVSGW
ncbi:MAG: hypothetical protein ACLQI7_14095, partial [Streptosporangiaceae bacterium]